MASEQINLLLRAKQAIGNFVQHGFSFGFNFGARLILNRMRDIHGIKVRAA